MKRNCVLVWALVLLAACPHCRAAEVDVDVDSDLNVDGDADVQSVVGANVTVNPPPVLDVDKLLSGLANMFDSSSRETCVKGLAEAMYDNTGLNVMVFNLAQVYDFDVDDADLKVYKTAKCSTFEFGVWAFCKGEFTNYGDGGYINWSFWGNFTRDDKRVIFHDVCF